MMTQHIGFFTPVIAGNDASSKMRAVEAFDNYFYLGGKECRVLEVRGAGRLDVVTASSRRSALSVRICMTALKVISYLTVIVPLIMLVGKAIARSKCEFVLVDKRNAARTIQSHIRRFQARKEFQDLKRATTKLQSIIRGEKEKIAYQKLKRAALTAQSHLRGGLVRKEYTALKNAAFLVQSRRRCILGRRELQRLKEALAKKNKEAAARKKAAEEARRRIQEQAKRRALVEGKRKAAEKAHVALAVEKSLESAFGKKKVDALKSIHEFVKSEKKHLLTLKSELGLMQSPEYKKFLRGSEEDYNAFCQRFADHIKKCGEQIKRFEEIADYLVISAEDCKKLLCFGKNDREKVKVLEKRTFKELRQDVKNLCEIVNSKSFLDYLREKVDIGCEREHFFELIASEEIHSGSKYKKVDPCFLLGGQRLMRYPDMLARTMSIVEKMDLKEEVRLLQRARDAAGEVSWLCNETKREIDDLRKYCQEHEELENTPAGYGEFIWGTRAKKRAAFAEAVEKYIAEKKVLEKVPKSGLSPRSAQSKVQQLWGELVAIAISKDVGKLPELLDLESPSEQEKTEMLALEKKFINATKWIRDPVKKKTLDHLITQIRIKKHWARLKVLTAKPKKHLDEHERKELETIIAEIGEKQHAPMNPLQIQSLVDTFVEIPEYRE